MACSVQHSEGWECVCVCVLKLWLYLVDKEVDDFVPTV